MSKTTIVKSSELGGNCWLAERFIEGVSRCPRVMECNYPKKKTCKAVDAEIAYLKDELKQTAEQTKAKIFQLERERAGL
jgi:hypothetical protein